MSSLHYRLGLDLGTNSIGWCVYQLNEDNQPIKIVRMGSRIFSDGREPDTGLSKAVARRLARQSRRLRDRSLKRRHKMMQALINYDLMPVDNNERKQLESLDPYVLRKRGLSEKLAPYELGRAIYHLTRKRGFQSSKKDVRSDKEEEGKVKSAISLLQKNIEVSRNGNNPVTVGSYLASLHEEGKSIKAKKNIDNQYDLYIDRSMVNHEFKELWNVQSQFYPKLLNEDAYNYLFALFNFRRPLRPVRPGVCPFEPTEYRARLCSPIQQKFRILSELNHIRILEKGKEPRLLTLHERNSMYDLLKIKSDKFKFSELFKVAKISPKASVNLGKNRKDLSGDLVNSQFVQILKQRWNNLNDLQQYALSTLIQQSHYVEDLKVALMSLPNTSVVENKNILHGIFDEKDKLSILESLKTLNLHFTEDEASNLSRLNLPDEFGSLSSKALVKIVKELENDVIPYSEAVKRAGYSSHSDFHTGEIFNNLPYYGSVLKGYTYPLQKVTERTNTDEAKYGKIANPTVHMGLNQIRQLINALIKRYGKPFEIVVEMTREFGMSGEHRKEIIAEQEKNEKNNLKLDAILSNMGQKTNSENRLKLKLWEELNPKDINNRRCIYSNQLITKDDLFSNKVEIDHILPYSKSLNDGIGNKILCLKSSNQYKGNQTPYEAWGHTSLWKDIQKNSEILPVRKQALFNDKAIENYLENKDFLDNQLNDTAYFTTLTRQYLSYVCHRDNVWCSFGRLTGLIRRKWDINNKLWIKNKKNRNDHRHHAVDAAIIGLCDRRLIQKIANWSKDNETLNFSGFIKTPFPTFFEELKESFDSIHVSHKPDKSIENALHEDTNYSPMIEKILDDGKKVFVVKLRRPIISILSIQKAEEIVDLKIKNDLLHLLATSQGQKNKEIKEKLLAYSQKNKVFKVLCHIVKSKDSIRTINDRDKKIIDDDGFKQPYPYRSVVTGGNYCYEVYTKPDGSWDGDLVSYFDANKKGFQEHPYLTQNNQPLIMRIYKGDILALETNGFIRYMRVFKFSGSINMVELKESNYDARYRSSDIEFQDGIKESILRKAPSKLKELFARKIGVDILGYVNDKGFLE
jgi:CRISPR-associated endonuclease Csn1